MKNLLILTSCKNQNNLHLAINVIILVTENVESSSDMASLKPNMKRKLTMKKKCQYLIIR